MMMKFLVVIFLFLGLYLSIQSCTKRPFACYKTNIDEDSIRVRQPVTFSALCSNNAGDYFWEFNDNDDSVEFTRDVHKTFYDTGMVRVYLLVTNGKKQSSSIRSFHINP